MHSTVNIIAGEVYVYGFKFLTYQKLNSVLFNCFIICLIDGKWRWNSGNFTVIVIC
jgi:hypothetical protein